MGDSRAALLQTVGDAYLEVFPARSIEEKLRLLPPGAYVAITCSPRRGIEATLELCERLSRRNLRLVPHIAARLLIDECHVRDVLARLAAMGVQSIFVPGGDVAEPRGRFASSLEVLRVMAEIGHEFEDVGVAAHPEGHPFIEGQRLLESLREKQEFATYLVTQMCFDVQAIIGWIADIRARGIRLPVWIGLPGVAEWTRLLAISLRIGVGESTRFLKKHKGLLSHLLRKTEYRPDDLLEGLAPYLIDPRYDIPGFHLFSFNEVERTEGWRRALLEQIRAP
jgi:methylenetetrahydrofolate reductase (NADPH)